MSFEINTAFIDQYRDNVTHLSQQRGSRLRPFVMNETVTGKVAYFEQLGSTEVQERTSRHADSPLVSTPHERRRVDMKDYEWGDLIDDEDKVRTLIDPTNPYAMNAAWSMGRRMDRVLCTAAVGDAQTGQEGGTTTSLPSSQIIDVDFVETGATANSDLTLGKLRQARHIFGDNDVDETEDQLYMAVTQDQLTRLLRTDEVINQDYNTVRALVNGEINSFMGFNFIRTKQVQTNASGHRRVFAFARSGLALAIGREPTAQIAPRPDKSFSTYVYYAMTIGATRLEEEKVVEILCDETV